MLGRLAATWGILGVCALLLLAIVRLSHYALALADYPLTAVQIALLAISTLCMAYFEGYKGFQRAFSPRVVMRAQLLIEKPRWNWVLLAPLFCMSYIAAPLKRQLTSIAITILIMVLVVFMRYLPQPWRGIIDTGVVVGLSWGLLSLLFYAKQALAGKFSYALQQQKSI